MNQVLALCKRDLLDIYKHALNAVKPDRLIKDCVRFTDGKFVVNDPSESRKTLLEYDLNDTRIHVVGGGKCVLAMARGLAEIAKTSQTTGLFSLGCLSVPEQSKFSFNEDSVTQMLLNSLDISVKFGSRDNLPDENSVTATKCIFDKISEASKIDKSDGLKSMFVVLISGGGSACLTNPKHLSLNDKSTMIKRLVQQGADIAELNTVRRCFSHVKGGNLSRHILANNPDAKVIALIMSDVIHDPIEIIASGPTCLSSTETCLQQSMKLVLQKYDIEVPILPCIESPHVDARSVCNLIIGNNKLAVGALEDRARELGYTLVLIGNDLAGTTDDVLDRFLKIPKPVSSKSLIVGAGESTVSKGPGESWGVGGRVQELALDYMLHKLSRSQVELDVRDVDVFMAGSTDGQDGPTDVAACLASFSEWTLNKNFQFHDLVHAKKSHDSYNFWKRHKPDWLVRTGPTGTNVMDLYMLAHVTINADV